MAYLYDLTDTWNAAGTVFNAIKMNVTNTASAAGSKIVSLQVGATDRFTVDKDGNGYFSGTLQAVGSISSPNLYIGANSGTIGMQDNTASIMAYNSTGSGGITNTLRFITGATERAKIDSSGNVTLGIGGGAKTVLYTDQSIASLNTAGSAYTDLKFDALNLLFRTGSGSATERARIDASGNLGVGTSSPATYSGYTTLDIDSATNGGLLNIKKAGATIGYINGASGMLLLANSTDLKLSATGANTVQFSTNSAERMRLDASGNLGLGVTPSAWDSSTIRAMQLGSGSTFVGGGVGFADGFVGANAYYNGTNWIYSTSNGASYYNPGAGYHKWFVAPSGTAGNAISFTQAMTLDASGNLGIGTSSPTPYKLNVNKGAQGQVAQFTDGIESTFVIKTASGLLSVGQANNFPLALLTNDTERMRIDTSGNVGIGTTSPGTKLDVAGNLRFSSANPVIELNNGGPQVYSTVANTLQFATGGGIGTPTERMRIDNNGNVGIGTTTLSSVEKMSVVTTGDKQAGLFKNDSATRDTIVAWNADTTGNNQFITFYTETSITARGSITYNRGSGVVAYNTTSDARLKENIAPADDASTLIDAIQVRKFDWKDSGSHQRYGFIAQELLKVAPEAVSVPADEEQVMGVDYSKLVPMLVKEIQSMRLRLAQLEGN